MGGLGVLAGADRLVRIVRIGGRVLLVPGEHQGLGDGGVPLRLRDIGHRPDLLVHLGHLRQDGLLPGLVELSVGPHRAAVIGVLRPAVLTHVVPGEGVELALRVLALVAHHVHHAVGRVEGRVVGDAGQAGTLGQGELGDILPEVVFGGGLHAVAAVAQIDIVQVGLQNLLFLIVVFQLQGGENLQNLSGDGDVVVFREIFNQLLGDGGAALDVVPGKHIDEAGSRALPVHPLVGPEALVLDGHNGVDQVLRDVLIGHNLPVFGAHQGLQLHQLPGVFVLVIDHRIFVHGVRGQVQIGLGHHHCFHIDRRIADQKRPGDNAHQQQGAKHLEEADDDRQNHGAAASFAALGLGAGRFPLTARLRLLLRGGVILICC